MIILPYISISFLSATFILFEQKNTTSLCFETKQQILNIRNHGFSKTCTHGKYCMLTCPYGMRYIVLIKL